MTVMVRRNPWRTMARYAQSDLEGGSSTYRLPIDVYDNSDAFVLTASVPGLNPEDIHINLEDDVLTIEGEFSHNVEDVNYVIRERASEGRFHRSVRINVPVMVEDIAATFDNGVLTLTVPKAPEAKPMTIPVKKIEG